MWLSFTQPPEGSTVRVGDSGRTQVRGQSCKLTGWTCMSEGQSFLPDVADPGVKEGLPCLPDSVRCQPTRACGT